MLWKWLFIWLSTDPTVEFMPLNHQLIANLPLNNNPMNLFYDPSNITIAFIVVLIVNLRTWDWTIVISVLVNMVLADDAGLLGPLGSTHQSKWSHHGAAIKLRPQISNLNSNLNNSNKIWGNKSSENSNLIIPINTSVKVITSANKARPQNLNPNLNKIQNAICVN